MGGEPAKAASREGCIPGPPGAALGGGWNPKGCAASRPWKCKGGSMTGAGCPAYIEAGWGPAETVAAANAGSGTPPGVSRRGGAGSEGGGAGRE